MAVRTARNPRALLALSVPVGLVLSGLLVWQASHAAFVDTTVNAGNHWSAGEVALDDDAPAGTAMFQDVDGLRPGATDSRCITVTYDGSVDAQIGLHLAPEDLAGALAEYLDFTVEAGDGGGFGDCEGFTPAALIYDGDLAGLAASHPDAASGAGVWEAAGGTATARTYRFTYTLVDDPAAQGTDATAAFTWEATSS